MTARRDHQTWLTRSIALVALFAALVSVSFSLPATAAASDNNVRLTIQPTGQDLTAYFKVTVEPGETVRLSAQLGNAGDATTKATTFAADAYTMPNGGFGVRDISADPSGPTTWVSYPTSTFEIAPGELSVREFDVTVPAGTAPGDYLTSLVIQNTDAIAASGDVALNQVVRQFVAIAIDVPGERVPALSINTASHDVTAGRSVIAFDVANTGNRHLQPAGEFVLSDAQGTEILRRDVTMAQFYALTETTFSVALDTLLAPGDYVTSLTLTDPGTTTSAVFEKGSVTVPVIDVPETVNADGSLASPATTNVPVTISEGPSTMMLFAIGAGCLVCGVVIAFLVMRMRQNTSVAPPASVTITNDPR